ncbi:trichohyalin [Cynoglossus semilaevis]|uniref:trichohyalin n=1 Tax=Cynoglossus semilaevis TaxID=244447 RepID=UPI000D62AB1A|nr:leucine-, glutamate- and lysine-rich protein 1 [Cynoglossus semilaevis]
MERSETLCRYCGVSYLVYHEFHQLNTRLSQLQAELQDVRAAADGEKARREAVELSRTERERKLELQMLKEKNLKEELEKETRNKENLLREEFERKRREMEEQHHKTSGEKEEQLRRELRDLEEDKLKRQREELERRWEEREDRLSDALQQANETLDEQKKYVQQLEHRGVCLQQVKLLQETHSVLRSSVRGLRDVRGFLTQMTGAWLEFKSEMLQLNEDAASVLEVELRRSCEEIHTLREEREKLSQQLTEQRKQWEEQRLLQEESEKKDRDETLRLKEKLEEKHKEWLSCQQRCDQLQEQSSSLRQREEQTNRKYRDVEEELTKLKEAVEKGQQETTALRNERDTLITSHGRALKKMEDDYRQQSFLQLTAYMEEQKTRSALHLQEQMEEFRKEVELELSIDKEKNRLLLQRHRQDGTQLQQKLRQTEQEVKELEWELQQERRRREEEIHQELQQEALQLSETKAELQLMNHRNCELEDEVAFLQETVRRECQEREDLIAALSRAQERLLAPQDSSTSPDTPTGRHGSPGNRTLHVLGRDRVLSRSGTSPNTLRASPAWSHTDGGGAGSGLRPRNDGGLLGGDEQQERTLPKLKSNNTVREVKPQGRGPGGALRMK